MSPKPPNASPPNLNSKSVTKTQLAGAAGVQKSFIALLIKTRGAEAYQSESDIRQRMDARYRKVEADGTVKTRFGVQDYEAKLGSFMSAVTANKVALKD